MRPLISTRLKVQIQDHFESRCTIIAVVETLNAARQKILTDGDPVEGYTDIYCRIGPLIEIRPTDFEIRVSQLSTLSVDRQCKLLGYFPGITPKVHRAVVDGETFIIVGVEHDGSKLSTRLKLEVIKP